MKILLDNRKEEFYILTMKKTVSVTEAAESMGISRQATWQAIRDGKLSGHLHVIGALKIWRIDVDEVTRYTEKRESK